MNNKLDPHKIKETIEEILSLLERNFKFSYVEKLSYENIYEMMQDLFLLFKSFEKYVKECGLLKNQLDGVKVLGDGELEKKLTIKANKFSKTAIEKLEKSGSTIEVI